MEKSYRQFKDTVKPDPMFTGDYDVSHDAIRKVDRFIHSGGDFGEHIIDITHIPIYTRINNKDVLTRYRIVTVEY